MSRSMAKLTQTSSVKEGLISVFKSIFGFGGGLEVVTIEISLFSNLEVVGEGSIPMLRRILLLDRFLFVLLQSVPVFNGHRASFVTRKTGFVEYGFVFLNCSLFKTNFRR